MEHKPLNDLNLEIGEFVDANGKLLCFGLCHMRMPVQDVLVQEGDDHGAMPAWAILIINRTYDIFQVHDESLFGKIVVNPKLSHN